MTRYLFTLHQTEEWYDSTPDEWAAGLKLHDEFVKAVERAGAQVIASEALQPSATAAVSDNRGVEPVVTDGPFIETKEALGGFYLIEVRDRAQALELAALLPSPCVEVRAVYEMSPHRDG